VSKSPHPPLSSPKKEKKRKENLSRGVIFSPFLYQQHLKLTRHEKVTDNGLGKDMWTLPLWKIENVLFVSGPHPMHGFIP
jgi:hypothetical protein